MLKLGCVLVTVFKHDVHARLMDKDKQYVNELRVTYG